METNKSGKSGKSGKVSNSKPSSSNKNKTSSKKKKPMNQTVKTKIFKESLAKLSSGEILTKALDLDEIIEMEEKSASKIKPKLMKDLSSIERAIKRNKNGGYIIFGDAHHGDLIFDLIIKLYPNLSEELQKILKNAYYFCEGENQMEEIKELGYGKKHIGLDKKSVNISKYDELKRNHQANVTWSNIILNNLTNNLTIISVGRSHLYTIRGKKETSRLETISSFQDVLKEKTHKQITVFTMNNDFDLRYDNYKDYAKTHQLDDVIDDPKIRSIFVM